MAKDMKEIKDSVGRSWSEMKPGIYAPTAMIAATERVDKLMAESKEYREHLDALAFDGPIFRAAKELGKVIAVHLAFITVGVNELNNTIYVYWKSQDGMDIALIPDTYDGWTVLHRVTGEFEAL